MPPSIHELQSQALSELEAVSSLDQLEAFRISYFGKKGKWNELLAVLKSLEGEDRARYGRELNEFKKAAEEKLLLKKENLSEKSGPSSFFDETLPGIQPPVGRIHPISQTIREITKIFERLGFQIVSGPE